jgi:hypothetical protein
MYITTVNRSGNNPLTGRAQYRVIESWDSDFDSSFIGNGRFFYIPSYKKLALKTNSIKKVGSIINPRKELFGG